MSVLVDVVNSIVDFEQRVIEFTDSGIYELLKNFVAWFVQWFVVAMWKAKLALLTFSWDVAQQILENLHISDFIIDAWSSLDSQLANALAFFRIPEAFNMIVSASVTKFVFRFLS